MHVLLETERLILRRFTTDDVDNLVELDGDPDVMLYINGGRVTPREEIATDYLPAFLAYYERGTRYGFWAVVEKSTGDFLGWFHYRPGEGRPDDEPELGYRFRKSAWGKGYAVGRFDRADQPRIHRARCAPGRGLDNGGEHRRRGG